MKAILTFCLLLSTVAAAGAAPAPTGWAESVQADLRDREYELSWQERSAVVGLEASWHAPNRAHGFRTYFTSGGIHVVPRVQDTASWEWGLSVLGYGRGGSTWPASIAVSSKDRNRIDFRRAGLTESYENSPRGLAHELVLEAPPEDGAWRGDGAPSEPVHVDLALTGNLSPRIAADSRAIDFVRPRGGAVLHYALSAAVDASGRELPAWIDGFSGPDLGGIRLVIDARDAVYPITVASLATSPSWTAEGDQASAAFGASVATAGDVDGDGYSDVIVGAPAYDNGQADEGRAFVYHGSASGLSTGAAWTAESDQEGAGYGGSVGTAGDVNGDGFSDVVVGASLHDNGETDEGRAFVYHGSASGLSTSAAWTAEGGQASAELGGSVAPAGDVNGDGFSDVIVGAEGRAFVHHGSAAGLATSPAWTAESDQADAGFGGSVATAGDVNGDGFSDVVVGASGYDNGQADEGRASVYHGSAAGLSTIAAWTAESDQAGAAFGTSVATAGNANGDGFSDVIVGAPLYDNGESDEGRAFVYNGTASGLLTSPGWITEANQAGAEHGGSVAMAGDVNGDGYADVIVGASLFDNGEADEGRASVYLGSVAGLATTAAWTAESDQAGTELGGSVATAGDVDGDGYADAIVGGSLYDNGQADEGRAQVHHGSAAGPAADAEWTNEGGQADVSFGYSVATAGDVNGDGYADVIVGAFLYDNGEPDEGRAFVYHGSAAGLASTPAWTGESDQASSYYAVSVGTAGDVNGDGYADVIVGAVGWTNGQAGEGAVFVYHGSATGLGTSPAWTREGGQAFSFFGDVAGTAGDVNGDGYSDVILGAADRDDGEENEGQASVYLGSAAGLGLSLAWSAEGNQPDAGFGHSVGTAGDVNGDGYSDVIVGSFFSNGQVNEGRAYVYHGTPGVPSTTPAWTAEGNQSSASFSYSVATAGDVNGDGYSDVIVGARFYDNGQADEGQAFVYHGSAAGLSPTPAWTADIDQASAFFGNSVATAGDVNGDGYSDVIVGAHFYDDPEAGEGGAFLYLGSASGLGTTVAWTAESDQADAQLGYSVASAGDVNGDGYADVIVGARAQDNGEEDEGKAYLYYGNGGRGLGLNPRPRRSDDAGPIARLGASDSSDSFRIAALGRSPFGRAPVRLEHEVEPLGSLFDGAGTQIATAWTDSGTSGAPLNEIASGLVGSTPYHWRVRLHYQPSASPFQQASRWFTMPWTGWQEWMLRTPVAPAIPAAGRVPLLMIGKASNGRITLTWGASCVATDTDYAIYPGTLGDFDSHRSRFCSTDGSTTRTFQPSAGSSYYLVVPLNAEREGSYGTDSAGNERPQGDDACRTQEVAACQ